MKKYLGIAIAGLMVATLGTSANAGGFGCYGSILGGMNATNTGTSLDVSDTGTSQNLANIGGFGSSGAMAGVGGGCDIIVDRILIGAMGDYMWHRESFTMTAMGFSAGIDLDKQWFLGGRAGAFVTDSTLVYLLAGWTNLSTNGVTGTFAAGLPDFSGLTLGGGIETALGKHVKLGLEYRHSQLGAQTTALYTPDPCCSLNGTFKPEMNTVLLKLSFGADFFGGGLVK